jgi:L-amino acid N-acyltransferase YncA/RNAse (barnase) inhibitor barstar
MKVWLDARRMEERGEAHAYLRERLDLPDYYGRNLDALYDCLTEMSGVELALLYAEEVQGYYPKIEHVLLEAAKENRGLLVWREEKGAVFPARNLQIRVAREEDAEQLLAIYAPYVEETAITFEYDVPSLTEFQERIRETLKKYPYLVAEREGEIVGYVYAGSFHKRAAYDWSVETSIYVRKGQGGQGIGKSLYEALELALFLQHVLNLNACIACAEKEDEYLTRDSLCFHQNLGYRLAGKFQACGYKFGRWYGVVWMEKHIGVHNGEPPAVRWFKEVREELAERFGIR